MRLHFLFAVVTGLLLFWNLRSSSQHHFNFVQVQLTAENLAKHPFIASNEVLPKELRKLSPEQEKGIFWKDDYRLWRRQGLPFQVDFYHLTSTFQKPQKLNVVDAHGAHPLLFSTQFFNYSHVDPQPLSKFSLGYAGFYVRYPINKPDSLDGFFSVLGSNYFRVLAKDLVYGLSARALAINTAQDGQKEEFPEFREWWLHEPSPSDTAIVLDALLDSPSVAGAYGFKIRPGAVTTIDIHASLFFRKAVSWLGIAPFSSMYLYGENSANHFGNYHPEIHDSDGVLVNTGVGDWLWRPLEQAPFKQVYLFNDENPKGFGLLQRDRNFEHYQDVEKRYNQRPSAWVTPHGQWGKGTVVIDHLPSNTPDTDNVITYWHPDKAPLAGERMELDYTLSFYTNDGSRPPLGSTQSTQVINPAPKPAPTSDLGSPATSSKVDDTIPVEFIIDYIGNGLEQIDAQHPPVAYVEADPAGTTIREVAVAKIAEENSWRLSFVIVPLKHHIPTEIHCRLLPNHQPEAKPLTEEWTYTWNQ